jgi:hypothetical protein
VGSLLDRVARLFVGFLFAIWFCAIARLTLGPVRHVGSRRNLVVGGFVIPFGFDGGVVRDLWLEIIVVLVSLHRSSFFPMQVVGGDR